jgi:hypothetical protein
MSSRLFGNRPKPESGHVLQRIPLFAVVFGGLGLALMAVAGGWALRNQAFSRSGLRSPGTVIGLVRTVSRDERRRVNTASYSPRVRFRTAEGRELEIVGLGANPPVYREGDPVTVLYPPDHPEQGIVDSHQELRDGPMAVAAFGLLFSIVGLVLCRARI